jgi:hypothetical protein
MKTLLLSLAAAAALLAAPALAQERADHHPAADAAATAATPKPMSEMNDAELHAHCKALMGHKMDGAAIHDHASMKGTPGVSKTKPLSTAEMKAQHEKCTAIMADASAHLKGR